MVAILGFGSEPFWLFLIYKWPRYFLACFGVSWPFLSREEVQNRVSRWQPSWILDLNNISFFLIYESPQCFLPSLSHLVQEKKRRIDFQDGRHGGHLGFPFRIILAIFYLQATPMLPTKFSSQLAFWFRRKSKKTDFQDSHHSCNLRFQI